MNINTHEEALKVLLESSIECSGEKYVPFELAEELLHKVYTALQEDAELLSEAHQYISEFLKRIEKENDGN